MHIALTLEEFKDNSQRGLEHIESFYDASIEKGPVFCVELARTLLGPDFKMPKFSGAKETMQKLLMLFGKVVIQFAKSNQISAAVSTVFCLWFGSKIPFKAKLHLQEPLHLCLQHDEIAEMSVFMVLFKQTIKDTAGTKQKLGNQTESKENKLFEKQIKFLYATHKQIFLALPKMQKPLIYIQKIVILFQEINSLTSTSLLHLHHKIKAFIVLLETLSLMDSNRLQKIQLCQYVFNSFEVSENLKVWLLTGIVRHSQKDYACPICFDQSYKNSRHQLMKFRRDTYQLLAKIYQLVLVDSCEELLTKTEEDDLILMILTGLRCLYNEEKLSVVQDLQFYELREKLISQILEVYFLILQKRPHMLPLLFAGNRAIEDLQILNLLRFTSFQEYLFVHQPEKFHEQIDDFLEHRQLQTFKGKTSKILHHLRQLIPDSETYFVELALFNLQKNQCIHLDSWKRLSKKYMHTSVSTETCFLIMSFFLFGKQQFQLKSFFQEMISVKSVTKMHDLAVTMALIFLAVCPTEAFDSTNLHIIDIGLKIKHKSAKIAAMRCLQQVSLKIYSPYHFHRTFRSIFVLTSDNSQQNWVVLKTYVKNHGNHLKLQTKCSILASIRKTFVFTIKKSPNYLGSQSEYSLVKCLELGLELLWNVQFVSVHPYIRRCSIDIMSYYLYLNTEYLKESMLPFINQVLLLEEKQEKEFNQKCLIVLPALISHYQETKNIAIIGILQHYLQIFHKAKQPNMSIKIILIFTSLLHFVNDEVILKPTFKQFRVYSYLLILSKYVLYFGRALDDRQIIQLYNICAVLQKRFCSEIFAGRVFNTLLVCSLYIQRDFTYFNVLQKVRKKQLLGYELQMLLKTLQISFTNAYPIGWLQRYVYLIQILYLLFQQVRQYKFVCTGSKDVEILFRYIEPAIKHKDQLSRECTRILKLFCLCKPTIFGYLIKFIESQQREFFDIVLERQGCQPVSGELDHLLASVNPFRGPYRIYFSPTTLVPEVVKVTLNQ